MSNASLLIGLSLMAPMAAAQTSLGSVALGSSGSATATLSIPSATTLTSISVVTQGLPNLDFTDAGGGSCATGTPYAAAATCTVNVTFSPMTAGARYGAVVLADASGVIATELLDGNGQAPQTTFLPGVVSPIASFQGGYPGAVNVAADAFGDVFVSDLDPDFVGYVIKEAPISGGFSQTTVESGILPVSIALDGSGSIYVATDDASLIKEVLIGSEYTERPTQVGCECPIAVDGNGSIYFLGGEFVVTLENGQYIRSATSLKFTDVLGVAVDGAGNLYVSDLNNGVATLYKETPANGSYTQTTILSGLLTNAGNGYAGVAVDGAGNVYVALQGTGGSIPGVYRLTPSGDGYAKTPIGTSRKWVLPASIAVDGKGNVYVADTPVGSKVTTVYKIDLADPPALSFAATPQNVTSADSPKTVTVSNFGNEPLAFSAVSSYPTDFPEVSGVTSDCNSSTTLAVGAACTLSIDFTPEASLARGSAQMLNGRVAIATNTLNVSGAAQQVAVSGSEINGAPPVELTVQPNPSQFGAKVTFAAKIAAAGASAPFPSGQAIFYSDGSSLGPAVLSNGVATLVTSKLAVGKHVITVKYAGDGNYAASASKALSEVVNMLTPDIKLVASANPGKVDSFIKFSAMVTDATGIAAKGTIKFYAGTTLLGSATLSKGTAELQAKLAAGTYFISARYAGDAEMHAVVSEPFREVVDRLVPEVRLASSANPAKAGSTVAFQAFVSGSGGTPSGKVVFRSGNTTLGTLTLIGGTAAWFTSNLPVGEDSITASYSGSPVYKAATSPALKENIKK